MSEMVYLGRDNTIDLILKSDGTAVDTSAITSIVITVGDIIISSSNGANDLVRWNQAGYDTGEIRLKLGNQPSIEAGDYKVPVVVYDANNLHGILWNYFDLDVVEEIDTTP